MVGLGFSPLLMLVFNFSALQESTLEIFSAPFGSFKVGMVDGESIIFELVVETPTRKSNVGSFPQG